MKRRDFLQFRADDSLRIVTLSCEALFMCFNDCRRQAGVTTDNQIEDGDWWRGEPPAQLDGQTPDELFGSIAADIANENVLILTERDWLADTEFAGYVSRLLAEFRQQGGEVRYQRPGSR